MVKELRKSKTHKSNVLKCLIARSLTHPNIPAMRQTIEVINLKRRRSYRYVLSSILSYLMIPTGKAKTAKRRKKMLRFIRNWTQNPRKVTKHLEVKIFKNHTETKEI